ncbi:spore germination protein [Paenibacillus soyae]|uniref:Spore germination protein n=1 Tax=Paenibacillus soyae TaxID=2969249 RepID=A0A9X2MIL4_9BACL|nr:spore germination protein [Paenibacillus soyae]MCR2802468.1 spore germination protein [Paenibacillus soyae]
MNGNIIDQEMLKRTADDESLPLDVDTFRAMLKPCEDVFEHTIALGGNDEQLAGIFYCDGLIDSKMFHMSLLPMLENWRFDSKSSDGGDQDSDGYDHPRRNFLKLENEASHLFARLFAGSVIVTFSGDSCFYEYNIANQPARTPEESTMELSLKGPRDGFVEQLSVNVALVRKRLRTPNLHIEYHKIGTDSQTEIALMHMDNQAPDGLLDEVRRRLNLIRLPALNGAGELEELISDRPLALFPLLDYVGRPDFVVQSLMKGRFAILVDGSPAALIGPGNLLLLIKSPEDTHLPFYFVTLERVLRMLGLFLALFLPAFWIAVSSYNTDQIPFTLLATVTMSRIGLPLSATMEMFLMLTLFEVFREAGVRLPRPVGQTVSVVGGLIIGDAAIRAGMTSPTMLVVAAVSAVSTFTLVNQSLAGTVTLMRVGVLILSSVLGMFGFFVGMFALLLYMCSLESFGQPYLMPLAPFRFKDTISALFQKPWKIASTTRKRKV